MMARQTRDQVKRFHALTEAQAALGWGVILILAALVGAIYLSQASRTASVGRRIQVLQNDLDILKQENARLERSIAEAQQLDRLQQEAARLGFVPAHTDDIEYLMIPNYPAAAPIPTILDAPAETAVAPPPPQTIQEAIWLSIRQQISHFVEGEANE